MLHSHQTRDLIQKLRRVQCISFPQAKESDQHYWDRILRDAYSDHVATVMQEQEALAKTLGKGKRVRKRINYTERDFGKAQADAAKVSTFRDQLT